MSKVLFHKYRPRLIKNILKWNFNFYFGRKIFPLIAAFRLTNKCNLMCQMCSIWQCREKKVFEFPEFKKIVKELGQMGCCYISLSGGEPLLIPNIVDYVYEVKKNGIFTNLVTNGLLINPELAKQFQRAELDTISISIDGFGATHDEIRGREGTFAAAIDALEMLKSFAPKIKIVVNTLISPWNIDELGEFCDFLSKKGVFIKFQPIYHHPTFDNQKRLPKEWQANEEFVFKCKEVVNHLLKSRNVISSKYFLRSIPKYFSKRLSGIIFDSKCFTGYYYCEFMENGRIFPCIEGMGWNKGLDMGRENLSDFMKSNTYREETKRLTKCKRCKEILTICYAEPKFLLPLHNFIYAKFNH